LGTTHYNIFVAMNILSPSPEEQIAEFFRVLGQPVRVQILLAIGGGEACVCHLEAYLGLRQALISQHLMVLRDAELVIATRDGRNMYYRLAQPELLELVRQSARMMGLAVEEPGEAKSPCPCPHCNPQDVSM
jgi:DNA-binding transcriptional ArsR family regulator